MAIGKLSIVENSCLCASSSTEYTVLLICPSTKHMANYTERYFGERDWQKLVDDEKFNEQVLKDVQDACKKGGIERFETPQRVKVVAEPWTPDTGLVTDALKLKRKAIEQKYKDDIEDLYQDKKPKKNNPKTNIDQTKSSKDESKNKKNSNENPTDVAKDIVASDNDKKKDQ